MSALMGPIEAEMHARVALARARLGVPRSVGHVAFADERVVRLQEQVRTLQDRLDTQGKEMVSLTEKIIDLRGANEKLEQALVTEMMKRRRVVPPPAAAIAKIEDAVGTKDRWVMIVEQVAAKHGVSPIDIRSQRRDRKTCAARHECFYRMKQETTLSLPRIGRLIGNRDHTTVLNGIHRHELRMAAIEGA